ncbi:DNA/RNA helicase domain-containing protein [Amycolatopsis sp. CB00013]|uniref:DNA/RNA helicase domain-containing protein n=1 Tax=Amycolatopsis sp. CB00013 TaxID=1703945 RepID=UPI0009FB1C49|nr:DNA/RNA helicase domain-containing protein [Amycolatopsis sp. CB00013]
MPTTGSSSRSAAPTLFDLAARALTHADVLALTDDQRAVLHHVRQGLADQGDTRAVVVVAGAAGTGKSALALTLLGEALRAGYCARHATGSQAFTTALRKTAGHGSRATQKLFQYFGTASDTEPDGLDLLVCDDAHQLRATSNTRYTPASRRSDRTQAAQLLEAARVVVFLLDEDQAIRPGQIGCRDYLAAAARASGATVHCAELTNQHRHHSAHYDSWIRRLLALDDPPCPPTSWNPGGESARRFELRVADSPGELEQLLRAKTEVGASTRITAGLCWPWSDPRPGNPLAKDIVIGDWRRPWSVKGQRAVNGLPPSPLWAIDPAGAGQIGNVYSAQGFEYYYGGVILGPELLWRDDRWVTDPAANSDDALDGATAADVDRWVRRTYRVLLTRATAGTVLYSTDAETRALLHDLIAV